MKIPEQLKTEESLNESVSPVTSCPKLIWPSVEMGNNGRYTPYDSSVCPIDKPVISERANCHYKCNEFWNRVRSCRALYILDLYLDIFFVNCLYDVIVDGTRDRGTLEEIHLLYGPRCSTGEEFVKIFEKLKKRCKNILFKYNAGLNPGRFPYVHDRFALTDDELWHFGSTVGGAYLGHTALSRGWIGQDANFRKFFNIAFHEAKTNSSGDMHARR